MQHSVCTSCPMPFLHFLEAFFRGSASASAPSSFSAPYFILGLSVPVRMGAEVGDKEKEKAKQATANDVKLLEPKEGDPVPIPQEKGVHVATHTPIPRLTKKLSALRHMGRGKYRAILF